ncbi:MAG TPA: GAF domain-containing protein [Ramlibacter sp.]|jgi:hypothetical protein|uniref:GAF domain-containing protein n=1 Tax=Ramlibacter sp. TaxID=1917967 RepID=UPI002D65D94F|nr:GAF domain-containing protein [Ramlibacter sp.]HZY18368.1 GAF domain-containing protein [Ramlibacter sp.]
MHLDDNPDAIDVQIADLLVATSDEADPILDPNVQQVLALLRERMQMDVVFVSQFTHGQRVFRRVDQRTPLLQVGASDPLEESWCQRVVDGRLPEFIRKAQPFVDDGRAPRPGLEIGTHLSTPVILPDGQIYGTLCCFSHAVQPFAGERDLRRLKSTANLLAAKLQPRREAPVVARRAPLST